MRLISCAILSAALMGLAAPAFAQTFPSKPLRFIVPFPPGGGTDLVARLIGKKLSESWGYPVVIDNRPGGGSVIGTATAARSAPDGHTFVIINSSYVILPLLNKNLPYDPATDLKPVIRPSESPNIVVTRTSLPINSIDDLIAYARKNPGLLNFAEGGFGGPSHLAAELFSYRNEIKMTRVSYKGTGPAVIDMLGGHVDLMFATITGVMPHVRTGKLRALAVTGAKRSPAVPELPTVAETGVKGYEFVSWYGVMVPSGTARQILEELHAELRRILAMEDVRKLLAAEGGQVTANGPADFARYIDSETKLWARVIADLKIRTE